MALMQSTSWAQLKALIQAKNLLLQYLDFDTFYCLNAIDGGFEVIYNMPKDSGADQSDFETNFKSTSNAVLAPLDSNGAPLNRPKVTESGWHFAPRYIGFTTGVAGIHNKDYTGYNPGDGVDHGDAVLSFYNTSGNPITQGEADLSDFNATLAATCTATFMDFEPQYNADVRGGILVFKNLPSTSAYVHALLAPDIPAIYGGSVAYMDGGVDVSFLTSNVINIIDGYGAKTINYDPTYHSGKVRVIVKHGAGVNFGVQFAYLHFRQ